MKSKQVDLPAKIIFAGIFYYYLDRKYFITNRILSVYYKTSYSYTTTRTFAVFFITAPYR
jgi:hypothetical protein